MKQLHGEERKKKEKERKWRVSRQKTQARESYGVMQIEEARIDFVSVALDISL